MGIFKRIFEHKLTDEENLIVNIISTTLDDDNTNKIYADNGKCYLKNDTTNTSVCYDGIRIFIIKENDCFEYYYDSDFSLYIEKIINNKIDAKVKEFENTIHITKCNILKKMN